MAGKQFPLEILIGALDRATLPLKAINQQIDAIRQPVSRLQKSFSALSREAGLFRLQRSLKEVGRATSGVFSSVRRLSTVLIGLGLLQGVVGLFFQKFIFGAAESAEKLAELSDQTGVTVESLQTLGFSMQQVGVSQEQFTSGLTRFNKSLGELKAGTGSLFSFLKRVDPAFGRTLQRTKSTEEAFRLFLDRLRKVRSESARAALVGAAFGRGLGALGNLAKLSAGELKALEDRARAMGPITEEQARNADKFNDSFAALKMTFSNLSTSIAATFFPVLTQLTERFTNWLVKNRPQVEAFAKRLEKQLPAAIEKVGKALADFKPWGDRIVQLFMFLVTHTGFVKVALIGLTAYIVGPLVISIATLAKSLFGLATTILSTPIGWFLVGLGGIAFAVYQIVDNWKLLKVTFLEAIEPMITRAKELWGNVRLIANAIASVGGLFSGPGDVSSRVVRRTNTPDSPKNITRDANVTVTFENTPAGTRVAKEKNSPMVNLNLGYQFGMAGAYP
jgi:hypothetical protein